MAGLQIAHFVHRAPPALGGAEAYFDRLARYHRQQGDTVRVWTTTAVDLEGFWRPGFRHERGNTPEIRRYSPLHFPARRYILKAISLFPWRPLQALTLPCNPVCPRMWIDAGSDTGPLDSVHATALPYSFPMMCALRLARKRRVPLFLTPFLHLGDLADPHDRVRRQYTQPPFRWLLRQADGIFVQTEAERQAVIAMGIASERVTLQGLGVDPGECTGGDRERIRKQWGASPEEIVIGHLANNSVEKGTVDLVQALPGSHRLVLAGPEMPNFRQFMEKSCDQKRNLVRMGAIDEKQKRDFFAGIDLFCLPSKTDSFGLVLLEAWANAKPVLVYRAGGPGELVRDGVDGWVCDCRVEKLRERLESLPDRATLAKLGIAGQQRIPTEFAWEGRLRLVREQIRSRL